MPFKDPERRRVVQRESKRRWRAENPEKEREAKRKWLEAHREQDRESSRQWAKDNPHGMRARHLKKYGITVDGYAYLTASQDDVCAVCSRPCSTGKRLAVDHCHTTGLVRGLLCSGCNTSAGKMGEDPHRILRLAAYVLASQRKRSAMIGLQIPTQQAAPTDQRDHAATEAHLP